LKQQKVAQEREKWLDEFFNLGYYFGMDWATFIQFPVTYKGWLMERITKEIAKASETGGGTKAAHHNTPEIAALQGKFRQFGTQSPRLQRPT
jgi:hypothetical protein